MLLRWIVMLSLCLKKWRHGIVEDTRWSILERNLVTSGPHGQRQNRGPVWVAYGFVLFFSGITLILAGFCGLHMLTPPDMVFIMLPRFESLDVFRHFTEDTWVRVRPMPLGPGAICVLRLSGRRVRKHFQTVPLIRSALYDDLRP